MAKKTSAISNEYISDSDSETESGNNVFQVPRFSVPHDFKKVKHLKHIPHLNSKDHELWLFKVPRDLDVSELKSLPVAEVGHNGQLKIKNQDFEVELDELESKDNSNMAVLSTHHKESGPSDTLHIVKKSHHKGAKKVDDPIHFDKIFTINKTKDIPKIQYDKVRLPRENVPKIEGLIVRHHATGYGDDEEEEQQQPTETKNNKRKHEEEVSTTTEEQPKQEKKKSKKSKKSKKDKKKKEKKD